MLPAANCSLAVLAILSAALLTQATVLIIQISLRVPVFPLALRYAVELSRVNGPPRSNSSVVEVCRRPSPLARVGR